VREEAAGEIQRVREEATGEIQRLRQRIQLIREEHSGVLQHAHKNLRESEAESKALLEAFKAEENRRRIVWQQRVDSWRLEVRSHYDQRLAFVRQKAAEELQKSQQDAAADLNSSRSALQASREKAVQEAVQEVKIALEKSKDECAKFVEMSGDNMRRINDIVGFIFIRLLHPATALLFKTFVAFLKENKIFPLLIVGHKTFLSSAWKDACEYHNISMDGVDGMELHRILIDSQAF